MLGALNTRETVAGDTPARGLWNDGDVAGPLNYANVRPYAIVDALGQLAGPREGLVLLPGWLDWGPRRSYDLSDHDAVRAMYERVLQEGRREDIARFVNVEVLEHVWLDLILPVRVRQMWEARFRRLGGLAA